MTYACHLINRLPSTALNGQTPLEVWSGVSATDYDRLHIFGCPSYYHVTESKLDPRAKKAIFLGFASGVKGYRLWCPESKKIVISRDIAFDEMSMLGQRTIANEVMVDIDEGTPKPVEPVGSDVQEDSVEVEDFADTSNDETHDDGPIALRKPKRNTRKPAKFNDMAAYALPVVSEDIPLSYLEARHSSEVTHWIGAMQEEMDSLSKNETWNWWSSL